MSDLSGLPEKMTAMAERDMTCIADLMATRRRRQKVRKYYLHNTSVTEQAKVIVGDPEFRVFKGDRSVYTAPEGDVVTARDLAYLAVSMDLYLIFLGDLDLYMAYRSYPLDPFLEATEDIRARYEGLSRIDKLTRYATAAKGLGDCLSAVALELEGVRIEPERISDITASSTTDA